MKGDIANTDKDFWHGYIDFYEKYLSPIDCRTILEFRVWKGESIRWLRKLYPSSEIHGVDILAPMPSWPKGKSFEYHQCDQGNISQIRKLFLGIGKSFDLIIEDGSHFPEHQRNCIVESLPYIRSGGVYILEDIHTSHPKHPFFLKKKPFFKPMIGPLHLLLAFEHLKRIETCHIDSALEALAIDSLFSREQVKYLFSKIEAITIYKRTVLPRVCFGCGNSVFNYSKLECRCGASLYSETDSISAILGIK